MLVLIWLPSQLFDWCKASHPVLCFQPIVWGTEYLVSIFDLLTQFKVIHIHGVFHFFLFVLTNQYSFQLSIFLVKDPTGFSDKSVFMWHRYLLSRVPLLEVRISLPIHYYYFLNISINFLHFFDLLTQFKDAHIHGVLHTVACVDESIFFAEFQC